MRERLWPVLFALIAGCAPTTAPRPTRPAPPPVTDVEPPRTASSPAPPAGAIACAGAEVDMLAALASPRCRIGQDELYRLKEVFDGPQPPPVKVEAAALDARRVEVRITNAGTAAVALPFFLHSEVDPFPAKASQRLLRGASPEWPAGFAYPSTALFAKIELPPGGVARATVVVDPHVVEMRPPNCPPNAKCREETVEVGLLPAGQYTLTLGTPLYSSRDELRASLPWSVGPVSGPRRCPSGPTCKPGQVLVPGCMGGAAPPPDACPPPGRCLPRNTLTPVCPPLP